MATIQLKCKSCDGMMNVDEEREVLFCPYCGSKEIFVESDSVKRERIRAKTYKDVVLGSKEIDRQMRLEEMRIEERDKKRSLIIAAIAFAFVVTIIVFCVLYSILSG